MVLGQSRLICGPTNPTHRRFRIINRLVQLFAHLSQKLAVKSKLSFIAVCVYSCKSLRKHVEWVKGHLTFQQAKY